MYFDTHAHLDDEAFDEDRDEVLLRLRQNGVSCVLDPGCDPESSRKAAALAEREDWIWFAAGIHPEELKSYTAEGLEEISALLSHPKCRAVGEIGLDYYWDDSRKEEQKQLFHAQLSLAREHDLPVVIHDREAHGDCLSVVKQYPGLRGVFHCYSGSPEMAEELLRTPKKHLKCSASVRKTASWWRPTARILRRCRSAASGTTPETSLIFVRKLPRSRRKHRRKSPP